MDVRFVEKGPIRVAGILTHGRPEEITPRITDIWMNEFMKYDEQLKPYSPDKAYFGAWFGYPDGSADYLVGMAVENLSEIPEGLVERVLPAAKYAVFACTVGTIGETYGQIYGQWLPASPYEYDTMAADFEFYPPDTETNQSPTEVYIPVKEKQAVSS